MNAAQRDGRACVVCGRDNLPLVPVGRIDDVQVFSCCEVPHGSRLAATLDTMAEEKRGRGRPKIDEAGTQRLEVKCAHAHQELLDELDAAHVRKGRSETVRRILDAIAEDPSTRKAIERSLARRANPPR